MDFDRNMWACVGVGFGWIVQFAGCVAMVDFHPAMEPISWHKICLQSTFGIDQLMIIIKNQQLFFFCLTCPF